MTKSTDKHQPSPLPWLAMIDQLPLSRTEQEVVKRFLADPGGRGFLPVADVLRSHRLIEESLELLTHGVQSHPHFAVARVVLARELYQRGMLLASWKLLEESPVSLYDNVLAQKLILKMALAFGDEKTASAAVQSLTLLQGFDAETRRLSDLLESSGIRATRDAWREELSRKGIELPNITDEQAGASSSVGSQPKPKPSRGSRFVLEYELDQNLRNELANYHVMSLREVFSVDPASKTQASTPLDGKPLELDSTTLAEIYAKQGHYTKALGIYRRLLRLAPHNDLLRLKVSELARLEKQQRSDDLEADPVLYDRMEVTEILDRQVRFFNHMLDKLK